MATDVRKAKKHLNQEIKHKKETIAEKNRIHTYKILARYRKKNLLMFGGLLASVCGIYGYSMFAVAQEDFSDFEK